MAMSGHVGDVGYLESQMRWVCAYTPKAVSENGFLNTVQTAYRNHDVPRHIWPAD